MAGTISELPFWPLFGIGMAFLGFGVIAATATGKTLLQIRKASRWPLVPATIAALQISEHSVRNGKSRGRLAHDAHVTFRFADVTGTARHVRYKTAKSTHLNTANLEVGKTTALRVNPADFTDFRLSLRPDTSEWIFFGATLAFCGFGLGLLTLAFF